MVRQWWIFWPLFAAIMGFALGGTVVDALHEQVAQHESHNETQKKKPWWSFLPTDPNFYIAVFSGCLVATSFIQNRALRRSNQTAEKAAIAAQKSADVADRTLVLSDRPWVSIQIEINDQIAVHQGVCKIDTVVTLKNVGRSPALNVDYFAAIFVSPLAAIDPKDRWIQGAASIPREIGAGTTIFPEGISTDTQTFELNEADFELAKRSGYAAPTIAIFAFYFLPSHDRRCRYTFTSKSIRFKGDEWPDATGRGKAVFVAGLRIVDDPIGATAA